MRSFANGRCIMSANVRTRERLKVNVATHWLLGFVTVVTIWSALLPCTVGLPLDQFYPFDIDRDNQTEIKDDGGSDLIQLAVNFPFFNTSGYRGVYVNNNGIISFKEKITVYKPRNFSDPNFKNKIPLIAPFWADVDIKNVVGYNESIVYRLTSDTSVIDKATQDVRNNFLDQRSFNARQVLIVTWYNVGFYGAADEGKTKRNTFQAVLITNGISSFAIFNYNRTVWTTGSNSGGRTEDGLGGTPAVVGFHSGNDNFYVVSDSGTHAIVNITDGSNIHIPGKYVFKIDGQEINDLKCAASDKITIRPSSISVLGGDEIIVSGPCLTEGQEVIGHFTELGLTFTCVVTSDLNATCVTPAIFKTGEFTFELEVKDVKKYSTNIASVHLLNMANTLPRQNSDSWFVNGDWWLVNVNEQVDRLRKLNLWSYKHNEGRNPRFELLREFQVEKSMPVRKFKVDSLNGDVDTLIFSLCWSSHDSLLPVCRWSDVFPVRWKSNEEASSEQWCNNWLQTEQTLQRINIHAPYCPCVSTIAENDVGHFHRDPICDMNINSATSTNCTYYPNAQKCFRRNIKRSDDSGETCCYNANGELLDIRDYPGAGTHQRYHYKAQGDSIVPFFSFFVSDLLPKLHCCQLSSRYCTEFISYRNATSCQGYNPPSPALAAGDPHIVTLDGFEYTFNGVGDYYLVYDEDSRLSVQVRAVQAVDNKGNLQKATVFSNVAVTVVDSSDVIEIRQINDTTRHYDVLVNSLPVVSTPQSTSQFRNISLYHNETGNFVIVLEPVSVSVRVEVTVDLLNIILLIGEDSMKGSLQGLLGNYNGEKNDDLIPRFGSRLPHNASMRDIHYQFGLTWNVTQEESILSSQLVEANGNLAFMPLFSDEVPEPNNRTKQICGDNKKCQYDLLVTNNPAIAESTKEFSTKFDVIGETLKNEVKLCPYLETPANGNKSQNGSAKGAVVTFSCNAGYKWLAGVSERVCREDGNWSSTADFVCVKKVEQEDKPFNLVVIGAVSATGVFLIIIGIGVTWFYRRRKPKEPEPPLQIPHVTDGPVFADEEYRNALMNISRDGKFRVPRPQFVNPTIFMDYF